MRSPLQSEKVRKTHTRQVSQKQAMELDRWERFLELHAGVYPATIAAVKLRMSPQGVYQAAQRGWIAFFSVGRTRWYSRKDVVAYRFTRARAFIDLHPKPDNFPKNYNVTS